MVPLSVSAITKDWILDEFQPICSFFNLYFLPTIDRFIQSWKKLRIQTVTPYVPFFSPPNTLLHPETEVATKSGTLKPFGRGAPPEDPNIFRKIERKQNQ